MEHQYRDSIAISLVLGAIVAWFYPEIGQAWPTLMMVGTAFIAIKLLRDLGLRAQAQPQLQVLQWAAAGLACLAVFLWGRQPIAPLFYCLIWAAVGAFDGFRRTMNSPRNKTP